MFRALTLTAALTLALMATGCPGGLSERLEDHAQNGTATAPPESAPAPSTESDDETQSLDVEERARISDASAALNTRGLSVVAASTLAEGRYHLVRVSWSCGENMPETVRVPSQYTGAFRVMVRRTLVLHDGHCQDAEGATGGWRTSTSAERSLLRVEPAAWALLPAYPEDTQPPVLGAAPLNGGGMIFLEYRYIGRNRPAH